MLLRGKADDGGVGVVSRLGGFILHVFLAPLPLVPSCVSVGNVLALSMYFCASFRHCQW
jgi:hypothetical protein